MKSTLICFEAVSGLNIKFCKSELIGIRVEEDLVHHYSKILGCKVGHLPTFLYGPPLVPTLAKEVFVESSCGEG